MNAQESQSDNKPLVTVIIPTYNYGKYISENIESVLVQTYRNLEIIVIDDGSTDNTREIIGRYPSVRYVYQKHEGNKTPARAMNLGVKLSKGDYICGIGADDSLLPSFIEECILEIEKDKRIGFVWTGKQEFGESNKVYMPRKMRFRSSILGGGGGALGAMLMRREARINTQDDENLHGREDWDLAIRLIKKGWKWKSIPQALYCARMHKQNLTLAVNEKKYVHELEGKYPLMRLYSVSNRSFKAITLLISNPKSFLVKLWNREVRKPQIEPNL